MSNEIDEVIRRRLGIVSSRLTQASAEVLAVEHMLEDVPGMKERIDTLRRLNREIRQVRAGIEAQREPGETAHG